jgi:hypothetical protein
MMTRERYCEFPSGNGIICVEVGTGCHNDIAQIRKIQLDPIIETKQLVWKPDPQKPITSSQRQSPSTQESVVIEFALPLQGQSTDYLYDESNNLEELFINLEELFNRLATATQQFNRLATAAQRLIDEFTNLSMLIKCPQFKERMKDLNSNGIGLCIVEYTKFLQLDCYYEELFGSYRYLASASRRVSKLLKRCLKDIQQPINPNILENLNNYLVIQKSEDHFGLMKNLFVRHNNIRMMAVTNIMETDLLDFGFFQSFIDTLELLRTTKDHCPIACQRILRFRKIIQELFKNYSAALGKTNDIQ